MPHPTSDRMVLVSAYAARMPTSQVFSHLTAAELLGLRLPERWITGPLDVGALHPVRAPKARGVRGHELLPRTHVVELLGVRVTAPVETWVALASRLSVDDLVVMGDGLVCRKNPVASVDDLQAAVADARPAGSSGSAICSIERSASCSSTTAAIIAATRTSSTAMSRDSTTSWRRVFASSA